VLVRTLGATENLLNQQRNVGKRPEESGRIVVLEAAGKFYDDLCNETKCVGISITTEDRSATVRLRVTLDLQRLLVVEHGIVE
jgi:hypothetical protein